MQLATWGTMCHSCSQKACSKTDARRVRYLKQSLSGLTCLFRSFWAGPTAHDSGCLVACHRETRMLLAVNVAFSP